MFNVHCTLAVAVGSGWPHHVRLSGRNLPPEMRRDSVWDTGLRPAATRLLKLRHSSVRRRRFGEACVSTPEEGRREFGRGARLRRFRSPAYTAQNRSLFEWRLICSERCLRALPVRLAILPTSCRGHTEPLLRELALRPGGRLPRHLNECDRINLGMLSLIIVV
jgi:hypothetical protein